MKNFSISQSLSSAWQLLKRNLLLIVFSFIVFIPGWLSSGTQYIFPPMDIHRLEDLGYEITNSLFPLFGISFVLQLILNALQAAFFNACRTVVKGGKAEFNAFDMPFSIYVKFVCAYICYDILVAIGFCFCLLPGLFIGVRLMFVPMIIIDDPYCGFTEAFQRSWDMTRGNFLNLFGFGLVNCIILIIGICCCCVGIYIAMPLITLAYTIIYMILKPEEDVIIEEETI